MDVLFTREDSIYDRLGCNTYPASRDARNYKGPGPLIAHPPCAQWSRLRHFAKRDIRQKALAPWAVLLVRQYGGVLEHPYGSYLWRTMCLPAPGERDRYGFTTVVDQHWFGHLARKRTLLYICGCTATDLPSMPITFAEPTHYIGGSTDRKHLSKALREATPERFAEWLIKVASSCSQPSFRRAVQSRAFNAESMEIPAM